MGGFPPIGAASSLVSLIVAARKTVFLHFSYSVLRELPKDS
jgi:hypothetical protein